MSERAGVHEAETEGPTMIAAIYARLNTKAIDRALQAQADRFSVLQAAPVPLVLLALAQGALGQSAFC